MSTKWLASLESTRMELAYESHKRPRQSSEVLIEVPPTHVHPAPARAPPACPLLPNGTTAVDVTHLPPSPQQDIKLFSERTSSLTNKLEEALTEGRSKDMIIQSQKMTIEKYAHSLAESVSAHNQLRMEVQELLKLDPRVSFALEGVVLSVDELFEDISGSESA